jgi:hypothetical protein
MKQYTTQLELDAIAAEREAHRLENRARNFEGGPRAHRCDAIRAEAAKLRANAAKWRAYGKWEREIYSV